MTSETAENRLKRLKMRSWRRGIKEMDLILGQFADTRMAGLDMAQLDIYERLLEENDHDLLRWYSGRGGTPPEYTDLMAYLVAQ